MHAARSRASTTTASLNAADIDAKNSRVARILAASRTSNGRAKRALTPAKPLVTSVVSDSRRAIDRRHARLVDLALFTFYLQKRDRPLS